MAYNCFPANAWFGKEWKLARRKLRESNKTSLDINVYKQILKKKKTVFMFTRREDQIFLGKNNPKLFWKELKPKLPMLILMLMRVRGADALMCGIFFGILDAFGCVHVCVY